MELNHLSSTDINDILDGKTNPQIDRHLSRCEKCRSELESYRQMAAGIQHIRIYESDETFTQRITQNIPDTHNRKEKPVLEIVSLVLVFVPFVTILGLLYYYKLAQLDMNSRIYELFTRSVHAIYSGFTSITFINNNLEIFGLFTLYLILFKTFDRLIFHYKKISIKL